LESRCRVLVHIELCETVPKEYYAVDVRWLFITSVHNVYT